MIVITALCSVAIDCGVLQAPFEGSVTLVDGHTEYGATAVYDCDQDNYMPYPDESRVCQLDGSWSGQDATCNIVDCGYPGDLPNGNQNGGTYTFNATVQYDCDDGYVLNGSTMITCEDRSEWSDDVPTCEPVFCGNPGAPQNAQRTGNSFNYQDTVTYTCRDGYIDSGGSNSIDCQANGQRSVTGSELLVCAPVECSSPGEVPNARRIGDTFTYRSTITYTCVRGYEISGSDTLLCMANGEWNASVPICLRIQPSITTQPPLSPATASSALLFSDGRGNAPTPAVEDSGLSDEAEAPDSSFTLSSGATAAIVVAVILAIVASLLFFVLIGIVFWRRETLTKSKVMPCKYVRALYKYLYSSLSYFSNYTMFCTPLLCFSGGRSYIVSQASLSQGESLVKSLYPIRT